jgi:hypothetical protein
MEAGALKSANPHRHRHDKKADAKERGEILNRLSHEILLYLICFLYVHFLFMSTRKLAQALCYCFVSLGMVNGMQASRSGAPPCRCRTGGIRLKAGRLFLRKA